MYLIDEWMIISHQKMPPFDEVLSELNAKCVYIGPNKPSGY